MMPTFPFGLGRCMLVLLIAFVAACGDGPTNPSGGGEPIEPEPPVPGTLTLVLGSPATDDGALVFAIEPLADLVIEEIRVVGENRILHLRPSPAPGVTLGSVFGDLTNGAGLIEVDVSDVRTPSALKANVLEVAGQDYQLRGFLGYTLSPTL